ncbi:MAG: trypsin-like peptidase domain-containing protein [Terriglobales bacterium]
MPVIEVPAARLPQQAQALLPTAPRVLPSRAAPEIIEAEVPHIILPALDAASLRQERDQRQRQHQQENDLLQPARRPARNSRLPDAQRLEIGINRDLRLSEADGKWFPLPGARVWMLDITSPASLTTRLHFTNFALPPGMKLYVSAPGANQEPLEFEDKGPFANGDFWSPPVAGDTVHLELLDESNPDGPLPAALPFQIPGLGHVYDDIRNLYFGAPQACELDATCYPDWSGSGDSVTRILFNDANYFYACSATLVNNASGDFSPLLLTASHCISSDALAQTLAAYFFYKSSSCNGTANENAAYTSSYATFLAATPIEDSDTSVLQLLRPLPTAAVWAAWTTADPSFSETLTGIHHPVASYRRISFGNRTTDESAAKYNVNWNLGITEPGSSGSPLFNANHQVVGQLHGGYSTCGVSGPDDYGKLNAAYDKLVGSDGRQYLEQGLPDDNLANNSRAQAYVINLPASFSNLVVKTLADDWFKVSMPANQGFAVDVPYVPNTAPRIEIYLGTDTVAIYSGDNHAEAGAGDSPTDFYVRIFLPPDPYYTGVRSAYSASFTSKQVAPAGSPTVRTDSATTRHNTAELEGYFSQTGNSALTSWFQWGTDPTLSTYSETPHVSSSYTYPSAQIAGLWPATQYYFRLAVDWPGGPIYGAILPFQTKAVGSSNYDPTPASINVSTVSNALRWSGYGDSFDVYFGTAQEPPFLSNILNQNGGNYSVSTGFFNWNPSTTYYWRIVAKYQSIAASTPVMPFTTENVLVAAAPQPFGNISIARNSVEQAIVIQGLRAVKITSVVTQGDFTQRNDCVGATVGQWSAGSYTTCTVYVTFWPSALGQRIGTLALTNDTYAMPFSLQLSGVGTELVMVLYRPARPSRPAVSSSAASFEVPLSLASSASSTCSVSPKLATCTLVRRESSTLITLVPVSRVAYQRKTAVRRARPALAKGRYIVSIVGTGGRSHFDIPVQVR